mmetsp:Transcript_24723/g.68239  ORF Transcript_24723/g.68239 Transcript_24723/m.68239 type:complete len:210 (-) Transcript_24723:321-950(-)|eukprot:CAMPEP_0172357204 /NCGR_PEP_ID=MMETSP1060-20121228/1578_1 /TAXON_ID=37318 /ORGANISM="Pseudo-nitzschia pungens, Strain cf. cingulata" /LENGTH=209 /DNA_ID=CAMNT_0013077749 /DNA_START=140 /DNA_END=769 /DNA_ORIENTATION=+
MNATLCRAAGVGRRAMMRPRRLALSSTTASSWSFPPPQTTSTDHNNHCNLRFFSDAAVEKNTADPDATTSAVPLSSPKLQGLYDRVVTLPEEEVNILGAMVLQVLGRTIFPGEFGTPGGAAVAVDGAQGSEAEEAVEEKTSFDVKLVGFDAKAKIKVIKEIRAIAGLGLKEAKELVESAPKVIQKDLKQEAADELKEKMEALGAQIEIV